MTACDSILEASNTVFEFMTVEFGKPKRQLSGRPRTDLVGRIMQNPSLANDTIRQDRTRQE